MESMKKILFAFLFMWGVAEAQPVPGYTYFNSRNNYYGLAASSNGSFHVPAGDGVVLATGAWNRSGALYYDSTGADSGLYVYHRPYWVKVGGTAQGLQSVITNNPNLTGDNTITASSGTYVIFQSQTPGGGFDLWSNSTSVFRQNDQTLFMPTLGSVNYDTTTYAGLVANKSTGQLFKTAANASGGPSTDSLISVTRRYNRTDTIALNNVGAFKTPTSAWLGGTSIEAGTQASVPDSALDARITDRYGLTVNNRAASSRGAWLAASRHLSDINPGHSIASFFTGWFNDWRRGGSGRKTQNKTVHTAKSAFVNQMLSTYLDAGGGSSFITFTGSWTGYSASTVGGKSNGKYTQTSGDTLIYAFSGQTNVAFGVIGMDGTTNAGANFEWYITNATTNAIVYSETGMTTNGQYDAVSDGSNDNSRGPMAFFKLGLTSTTSYKLKIVSKQSTNVLAVDYVGHMVDPVGATPIVWMKPTRMDATGYAVSPNLGSDIVWDDNNLILDSLYAAVIAAAPGYPVYLSETDDHFDPSTATDLYSDHIHLQDHGFYDYALTIFEALPVISTIPTAGTFIVVNNIPYYSDGTELHSMISGSGSGTPGGSVNQVQYNSAGSFGGIPSATTDGDDLFVDTLWGGTSSAGKLILQTTQHATKGELRVGTTINIDDNNGRMGISSANTLSSARLYIVGNTGVLGDDLLQMKMVTSQTGSMLKILDASSVISKQISSTGAEMIGSGDWALSYAKPALYAFRNGGNQYMRFYNGSTWEPVVMEGITWSWKAGAGAVYSNTNSSGRTFFGGSTTATSLVHLGAGTATASTAPLKFTSGTNLTTAEAGVMEYNGAHYITKVNAVRMGIGANLKSVYTSVGNVGAGEDDLQTFTVPAGTLSADGDYLDFAMSFTVAVNSTLKVKFGATQLFSFAALATDAVYRVTGQVVRTGAATQRITFQLNGGAVTTVTGYQTAAETLSGTVVLKATGEGTADNDIVQTLMTVKYFPTN